MNVPMRMLFLIFFVSLTVVQAGWFDSEETKQKLKKQKEPDHLTLAALMIRDGHYDRARAILMGLNTKEDGFQFIKFNTLFGLIYLNQGEHADAQNSFLAAIEASGNLIDPMLYVYTAQAFYAEMNFERTLWALNMGGEAVDKMPDLLGVKATCCWKLGRKSETFAVLENADARYSERSAFKIRTIQYLIEMQLYNQAVTESEEYLERFGSEASSYLVIGEAFRRSKNYIQALRILEKGHLLFPDQEKLLLSLAHTYMQNGKNFSSARLFEKMAVNNPRYLLQAIALYRMVGDTWKAKFLNAKVADVKVKLKNWMEILLAEENYEEILAIESRLNRYDILDDKLSYAMAYVHFISGDHEASEAYLKGISDPQVFKNSVKLLKAIESHRSKHKA
jgi:tetratricopeptide (TPR) repeat protein